MRELSICFPSSAPSRLSDCALRTGLRYARAADTGCPYQTCHQALRQAT